jgi:hypothetical protein
MRGYAPNQPLIVRANARKTSVFLKFCKRRARRDRIDIDFPRPVVDENDAT